MSDETKKTMEDKDLGSKEQEMYAQRLDKAGKWKAAGANPYGNGFRPTHLAADILGRHQGDSAEQLEASPPPAYTVAGRIVAMRSFGKAAFIKLRDRTGEIQAHVKKDALGDLYEVFKQCDLGDFVAVQGPVFRSKTGELSLSATKFVPLTKALRPMPEKWHGLTDVEI